MATSLWVSVVGVIALSSSIRDANSQSLNVTTQYGDVNGFRLGNVDTWYGIRYAKSAIGDLRWKAPQPPSRWKTPLKATTHLNCYQYDGIGGHLGSEEDCLTMDVWAPADRDVNVKLPVMVWIHGGLFTSASPGFHTYNGTNLVRKSMTLDTPTIIVAITYRLGGLGFMAYKKLAKEEGAMGSSGNYGVLDQIVALKFIQNNIGNFGGDKDRVAIFGQSAGAYSVCTLLASPLAVNLFRGAMMESAYCALVWYTAEVAELAGDDCAKTHNACSTTSDPVACMRKLPVATAFSCTITSAAKNLPASASEEQKAYSQVLPNIDGYLLTRPPLDAIRYDKTVPQVPVVVGSNNHEYMIYAFDDYLGRKPKNFPFSMSATQLASLIETTYRTLPYRVSHTPNVSYVETTVANVTTTLTPLYQGEEYETYARGLDPLLNYLCSQNPALACNITAAAVGAIAFFTDYSFTSTAAAIVDAVAFSKRQSYRYLMKQNLSVEVNTQVGSDTSLGPLGCYHSLDVPFLFDNFGVFVANLGAVNYTLSTDERDLSSDMQEYWLSFANTLKPNPIETLLPKWTASPQPTSNSSIYMQLVQPGIGMGEGFHASQVDVLLEITHDKQLFPPPHTLVTTTTSPLSHGGGKLSAGDDVGIVIGVVIVVAFVIVIGCYVFKRKQQEPASYMTMSTPYAEYETENRNSDFY